MSISMNFIACLLIYIWNRYIHIGPNRDYVSSNINGGNWARGDGSDDLS